MFVNKNIDINIVSYPISMAISIVPNIVDIDIDISLTPARTFFPVQCPSNRAIFPRLSWSPSPLFLAIVLLTVPK